MPPQNPCSHKETCPAHPKSCGDCTGEDFDALKHLIEDSVSIGRVAQILNEHKGEALTERTTGKILSEIRG